MLDLLEQHNNLTNLTNEHMYHLGLCELHCFQLHGGNNRHGHYLVIDTFNNITDEDTDGNTLLDTAKWYNESYQDIPTSVMKHYCIRNYSNIISRVNYIKPEIMEIHTLETGEMVAILKTWQLRVFQRVWRRYFAKRMQHLKYIPNILKRQLSPFPRYLC